MEYWIPLAAVVASVLIGVAAGRSRASAGWGLLGPIGWIIAAIHSLDHDHGIPRPTTKCPKCAEHFEPKPLRGRLVECPKCEAWTSAE